MAVVRLPPHVVMVEIHSGGGGGLVRCCVALVGDGGLFGGCAMLLLFLAEFNEMSPSNLLEGGHVSQYLPARRAVGMMLTAAHLPPPLG